MTLQHCIIHHIERSAPGADVVSTQRDEENNNLGNAYSLFEQLKQSYQRSAKKQYGHFDRDQGDNPLPGWLRDFQQAKSPFIRTSGRLLEQLQQKLEQTDEAFSAHIVIAVETLMDQHQLYLFWVNHVESSHIDSQLEVAPSYYVDTSKLQFAARLYVDEWLEQDSQKYLSMISSRGNKDLSDAFVNFLGFSSGVDLVEQTSEFLNLVDRYTDALPEEKTTEYKGKILDYCVDQDKQGFPVVFEELSSQLDTEAPAAFADFISDQQQTQQQTPHKEIYTDRNSLKRYVRYFGRDKNMSISFSSDMYGDDIIYDEAAGTLTIKQIPKSLQQQLKASTMKRAPSQSSANTDEGEREEHNSGAD